MEQFCIAMLVHDAPDRADALRRTFVHLSKSVLLHPDIIPVYILVNGTNPDIEETLEFIQCRWQDDLYDFHITHNETNVGCGAGINQLNELTRNYTFTLFLEADWIPIASIPYQWLDSALSFMKQYPDVDAIYLRRFRNDYEIRHHGAERFFTKESFEQVTKQKDIPYRAIEKPVYTNNPLIRRNARFYETGIFPFPTIENEQKGSETWSASEEFAELIPQQQNMKFFYADCGWFLHQNPEEFMVHDEHYHGTSNFPQLCQMNCKHTKTCYCKYGFVNHQNEEFCSVCHSPLIDRDYTEHDKEYIRTYHQQT